MRRAIDFKHFLAYSRLTHEKQICPNSVMGLRQINLANLYIYLDKWIVLFILISAIIFISALTHILNLSQAFLSVEHS